MSVNEPRTNNPGLSSYIGRTAGIAIFLFFVLSFAAVHFYYATSALLDILAVFILFLFLFFFFLSLGCLALCASVGPGALPTRFSAARMETFIREELRRVVAKARAGRVGETPATAIAGNAVMAAAGTASSPGNVAAAAEEKKRRWQDLDDAEEHQLANVASAVALTQRASPSAAEAEWEKRAAEARLRMHDDGGVSLSSSEGEDDDDNADPTGTDAADGAADGAQRHHRRRRHRRQPDGGADGDAVVRQEDGSIPNSADDEVEVQELPAYMPEMMQRRRQRKIRRGLEVIRVSEAAQRMLDAVDSDDFDRKREEMSYLIPGANWCRFCSFYQMNDTRHCTTCGRCVYRCKLHCVCCAKCIGYANSKYYVLFLFHFVMAFLMANFLDLYCITSGYTYFFKVTGERNTIYYLVFVYSYAFVVLAGTLLAQYILAEGKNVGLLTELQRAQKEELRSVQLRNSGELYQPIMSDRTASFHDDGNDSPEQASEPFMWSRAMNAIGEGLPFPLWFWPVPTRPAVNEMDDPEGFWTNLTEAIRIRLRSVADVDDAFTDDDDEPTEGHADTSPASAVATSATAALPASLPPTPAPRHAVSSDVTVVPVAVAVPVAPRVNAPASEDEDEGDSATTPARAAASSPAPPVAKMAPASRKKVD